MIYINNLTLFRFEKINIQLFLPNIFAQHYSGNKKKLSNNKLSKDIYLDRYKSDITQANGKIIHTSWAYISDAGIIEYEKSICRRDEYKFKENDPVISAVISRLNELKYLRKKRFEFIVYGCGNAIRENQLISQITTSFITGQKKTVVHFIDISPYYCNQFRWTNKLDIHENTYEQRVYMIDFIKDKEDIIGIRATHKNKPVIHLMMGNIAGNYKANELREITETYCHKDDVLIMEYGIYNFNNAKLGNYHHEFARKAFNELFYNDTSVSDVNIEDIIDRLNNQRCIKISYKKNGVAKQYSSFLRRNFESGDFTKGYFQQIKSSIKCGQTPCGEGKRKLSIFRKLL